MIFCDLLDLCLFASLPVSALEIVAVICGLVNIYLTVRQNIWSWAFGAVMVSLYIYIFFHAKLSRTAGCRCSSS